MTAVAVVTPSSGSNSAAVLLFWVGADTVSSSYVACGDVLLWRPAPNCARVTGLRSKPAGGVPLPREGHARGPLPRTDHRRRRAQEAVDPWGGCPTREGTVRVGRFSSGSAAQTEPLDERAVPVDVGLCQVVQQPAAATDQQEQAPPAVVVVLVLLEVLGQVADPAGQHRDLHLGRARVLLDRRVLGHDLLLRRAVERHRRPPGAGPLWPPVWGTGAAGTHRGGPPSRQGYTTAPRGSSERGPGP